MHNSHFFGVKNHLNVTCVRELQKVHCKTNPKIFLKSLNSHGDKWSHCHGLANLKPPLAKIATISQEVFIIMHCKFKAHSPSLALDIDIEFTRFL